jgi:hypothetical protein
MSGSLFHNVGWEVLNLSMMAPVLIVALATFWLQLSRIQHPSAGVSGVQ